MIRNHSYHLSTTSYKFALDILTFAVQRVTVTHEISK